MYLIAILVLIGAMLFTTVLGQPIDSILHFYDIPSLIIILFITLPMLMASGLFPDLKRAFKIAVTNRNIYTKLELQRSQEAVQLTMRLLIISGLIGFLVGLMNILKYLNDLTVFGPNLSVDLIVVFYSLFGCLIFMPIKSKLKVLILASPEEQ